MNLDLWQQAAETQNRIITVDGDIYPNNKLLWRQYLHTWDNQDWASVLKPAWMLLDQHPHIGKHYQREAIETALLTLMRDWDTHPRTLDTKANKGVAWRAFMSLRELWNQCN